MFGTRDARPGSQAFPLLTFLSNQGTTPQTRSKRRSSQGLSGHPRPSPGGHRQDPARTQRPDERPLTCRKQKGTVSTLTPTMLFTTFMIRPQLEPAAAAAMARSGGSPRRGTRFAAAPRAPRSARYPRPPSAGRARHGPTGPAPTRHRPQRHFRLPPPPQEVTCPRGRSCRFGGLDSLVVEDKGGVPMVGGTPGKLSTAREVRECTRTRFYADPCVERHGDGCAPCLYMSVCIYTTTHDTRAGVPGVMGAPERPLEGSPSPPASPPACTSGHASSCAHTSAPHPNRSPPPLCRGRAPPHPTG